MLPSPGLESSLMSVSCLLGAKLPSRAVHSRISNLVDSNPKRYESKNAFFYRLIGFKISMSGSDEIALFLLTTLHARQMSHV